MQEMNTGKSSKRGRPKNTTSQKSTKKEESYSAEWYETYNKYKATFPVFEKYQHIYDLYAKCGEVVNFHKHIQDELLEAFRVHDPHYRYNSKCPVCVAEFLHNIYSWYKKQIDSVWQS